MNVFLGPLLGAVIGYCTNYIAVRMLFRPLYPVRIGRFTLPFTPGLIPKEKARLAKTLGATVGNTLFTAHDVETALLSPAISQKVVDGVMSVLDDSRDSLRETVCRFVSVDNYYTAREELARRAGEGIAASARQMQLGRIVAQKGLQAAKERSDHKLWKLLLTEKNTARLEQEIEQQVDDYLDKEAAEAIRGVLMDKIGQIELQTPAQLLAGAGVQRDALCRVVEESYTRIVREKSARLMERVNIARVVQDKIDAMDVRELEKLTLSVMKKELDAIVNLGALIGFALGLVNLLF